MTAISSLPFALDWALEPHAWELAGDKLIITSGARTDLFADPGRSEVSRNMPRLTGSVSGDFMFSARVTAGHKATFDAGALLLSADDDHWAKLAFELSADGLARVVSVVTRSLSDDCDSFVVPDGHIWLRISRIGPMFALHASADGTKWTFVRQFALGQLTADVAVGFSAQSPTGEGCTATFDDIRFTPDPPADLRDGS
jgi:regulation of enolase protein 1 (concanavalin A-like superfamily)